MEEIQHVDVRDELLLAQDGEEPTVWRDPTGKSWE
jgi:hypothetical protein